MSSLGKKSISFFWHVLKEAVVIFMEASGFPRAAALSYYTIFALPPMLLIILFTTTLFVDESTMQATVYGVVSDAVGRRSASELSETVREIGLFEGNWWATVIGLVGLLISSTTVFVTMQGALNHIFKVKPKPKQGWLKLLRDRALSFSILLAIAFILMVSLLINALIGMLGGYLTEYLPTLTVVITAVSSLVLPIFIIMVLFALIFRFLPDVRIAWRNIWRGATFTSLLFLIGKYVIDLYIGTTNTANLYDAAGSVMVILVWVFYASAIFLYGASFTYAYTLAREDLVRPASYAVRVERSEVEVDRPASEKGAENN